MITALLPITIEIESAGLLELRSYIPEESNGAELADIAQVFEGLGTINFSVDFIHRTAIHFLTRSYQGRELLAHCSLSDEQIMSAIAKAKLCKASLCTWIIPRGLDSLNPSFRGITWLFDRDRNLELFCGDLSMARKLSDSSRSELYELIRCEFERKSLTTFSEVLALTSNIDFVDRFLRGYDNGLVPTSIVAKYLLFRILSGFNWNEQSIFSSTKT